MAGGVSSFEVQRVGILFIAAHAQSRYRADGHIVRGRSQEIYDIDDAALYVTQGRGCASKT